jgi:hypothetical protein
LPGKLSLPDLPAQYSNLQLCCIYAGVDEQKTPREHLGEPIFQLIINRVEQSRRKLKKLPWCWSTAASAFAACAFGLVSDQPALAWASAGLVGLIALGLGLNLVRKRYEPSTEAQLALAQNDEQKSFVLKMEELRYRLSLGPDKGGILGTQTVQSALGGHTSFPRIHPSIFMCDHGRLLLITDSGFEAVRTWRRKPTGPIQMTFSAIDERMDLTSAIIANNPDKKLACAQINWRRNQVTGHGEKAAAFTEMLDLLEGMIEKRGLSEYAMLARIVDAGFVALTQGAGKDTDNRELIGEVASISVRAPMPKKRARSSRA